jgi:hypothetical protein
MTQYIAKSTLITDGVRYQLGNEYSSEDLKGLSDEEISAHFKEVVSKVGKKTFVSVVKTSTPAPETQSNDEINEEDGEDETGEDETSEAPEEETPAPDVKPAKPAQGKKGKNKGKGGRK